MHPTAWLFGCLAFFYTFRFWDCRFSHAVVQLIEVRGFFFLCMCLVSKCTCSTPHLHSSVSPFCGILRIFYITNLLFVHCLLRLENILRYQTMTNVYFKHSTEFIMASSFEMKHGNLPSMVKRKSFEIFCVKPSSFAFKSLQFHSSLLQFENIGSDFHIWFSTTFLGHQ